MTEITPQMKRTLKAYEEATAISRKFKDTKDRVAYILSLHPDPSMALTMYELGISREQAERIGLIKIEGGVLIIEEKELEDE